MISVDAVYRMVGNLQPGELERWVDERWVMPEERAGTYVFHEVDVARVRLIVELRQDLAIDEETVPLVLGLLDQVYGLRRRLRLLSAAIEALPEDSRLTVRRRLEQGD